jgi:carbon monoxide dehydrogenase subunit G
MTVRVERSFEFEAPPERIWAFIADPAKRAGAISVVESYEVDGDEATWHVSLPIPLVDTTVAVETRETDSVPPEYVRFEGRSRAFRVVGEHEIETTEDGCRLLNQFVVEGRVPGVERFFERNFERELDNLQAALDREVARRS